MWIAISRDYFFALFLPNVQKGKKKMGMEEEEEEEMGGWGDFQIQFYNVH